MDHQISARGVVAWSETGHTYFGTVKDYWDIGKTYTAV